MNIILFISLSFAVFISILCNNDISIPQFKKLKMNNGSTDYNLMTTLREIWFHEPGYGTRIKRKAKNDGSENATQSQLSSSEMTNNTKFSNSSGIDKHALLVANFKRSWPVGRWREYGFFSEDYLDLINEHWLQFPPPPESLQKFLGSLYLVFSTVGCWGNITVLFMYFR